MINGTQVQIGFQHPVRVLYFPNRIVSLPKDGFALLQGGTKKVNARTGVDFRIFLHIPVQGSDDAFFFFKTQIIGEFEIGGKR
jgi:hypothetical protein